MEIAIIGRKESGKTLLFSILTQLEYHKFSVENQVGVAKIPDFRVDKLVEYFKPKSIVHAKVTFIDFPGVAKEEFYSAKRIAQYKNCDALCYVIPYFMNQMETNEEKIEPEQEIKKFEEESIIADLSSVETRIESLKRSMQKRKEKEDEIELKMMIKLKENLEKGIPIRSIELNEDEKKISKGFSFLTQKPILYILNISEQQIQKIDSILNDLTTKIADSYHKISFISCQMEYDLMMMNEEERNEFLKELNLKEDAKTRILQQVFSLLDQICFFTVGQDEVKAWQIKKGTCAKEAAGTIHSDIEKGFIRAEVYHYSDWEKHRSEEELKREKLLRLEMKDYEVKDGDIIHFRFNK
ncbi:MAG: DUF933 domain-containing protein [Exilispira sp.]|jgi:GTP-binding protein YchF|nr:DUF933 domain-containing protein [Exilispira sp.]